MKNRKLWSLAVFCAIFVICALLLPAKAEAATVATGKCGNLTWTVSDAGKLSITGSGAMPDYTDDITKLPWYNYMGGITSISVGNSVTHIGNYAFAGCIYAKSVTIGSSVKTIGEGAFMICQSLTSVSIPYSVTTIGTGAFAYCESMTSLTMSTSGKLTTIGQAAFAYCTGLTSLSIPTNVVTIETAAFLGCTSLKTCTYQIAAKLTTVGEQAFADCTALTRVKLPTSTKTIGGLAYAYCTGLNELHIQKGVTTIGNGAFGYCTALTEVSIPSTVTTIGYYPFYFCQNLKKITVDSANTAFVNDASGVLYDRSMLQLIQAPGALSGSYTVPSTVNVVCHGAFGGCDGLTAVSIPSTVTTIGDDAFSECTGLTALTLPNSLQLLGYGVLYGCTGLTQITVPSAVTSIGDQAFAECANLKKVTFNGTAPAMGEDMFLNVTAAAVYNAHSSWTDSVRQNYGGNITWQATGAKVKNSNGMLYSRLFDAVEDYDPQTQYLILLQDVQAFDSISKDVYIDLNGYDLSGKIETNGYKIYGMDSTTNEYTCDGIGYFSCVDRDDSTIVPETHFKSGLTGDVKRYMTVKTEDGYSFHRIYLAVTHMSLRPGITSVGFKAAFYGDSMVVAALDQAQAFGYTMGLAENTPVTVYKGADSFVSGKAVTLRIDNYDIENYGETALTASVMLKLQDGTVIRSNESTMTMRGMIEQLNEDPSQLTEVQKNNILALIEKNPIMKTWDIQNLYNEQSDDQSGDQSGDQGDVQPWG